MKTEIIREFIEKSGILLLNDNPYLPSVSSIGGDWESILSLIETRDVFLSKVYKGRTAYLSRELYFYLRVLKHDKPMDELQKLIYEFIDSTDGVEMDILKQYVSALSKDFDKAMNALQRNLYVTAIGEGKKLSSSWSTYIWGTFRQWEEGMEAFKSTPERDECEMKVRGTLSGLLKDREIDCLLK